MGGGTRIAFNKDEVDAVKTRRKASVKTSRTLMLAGIILWIAGAALCVVLIARFGLRDVFSAVAAAKWGVLAVIVFHAVPLMFDVWGWQVLLPLECRLRAWTLMWMRWMGESFAALLPVAQLGGDILRVRLAAVHGGLVGGTLRKVPMPTAVASVMVGITMSLVTQIVFALSGLMLLVILTGHGNLVSTVVMGSIFGVMAALGFYKVQQIGIFRILGGLISRMAKSGAWADLMQRGDLLDQEVRRMYTQRKSLFLCCVNTMGNWLTGAAETWIAMWALGIHAGYGEAYVLESMSQAIRSAAFLVPGALGLQEGGYVLIGAMFGIPGDTALALSLIKRARELAWGVPGILGWQWLEGRNLLAKWRTAAPAPAFAGPDNAEAPDAAAPGAAK